MAEPPPSASPALADGLAVAVTQVYAEAEQAILAAVTVNIRAALRAPDTAAALRTRGALAITTARRAMARADGKARRIVPRVLAEAYGRGHGIERRTAEHALRDLLARLAALGNAVMQWVTRLWNRLTGAAHAPDPLVTADRIMQQAAARGVTAFIDSTGRRLTLVPYVEQAVQHAAGNAAMDGYLARLAENGDDLVIVSRSKTSCPICRPWVGRVLSSSGVDPHHPSVATARAAGLWHPNCVHTIFRWYPGFRWPDNAATGHGGTQAQYEATQRQRAIERHIRTWKRREAAALDDLTRARAARKVRAWQAELRAHLAAEGLRRSRQRERTDFGHTGPRRHALGG